MPISLDSLTPEELAALNSLSHGSLPGSIPASDPEAAAGLAALRGMTQRSTPPPPAPPPVPPAQPSPLLFHRNPNVAVALNGRVIDPTTGQPFPPRGQADPNAEGPSQTAEMLGGVGQALQPVERFTTPHLVNPALRVLAAIANPVQQAAAEGAKGYRKGGVAGIIPGIEAGAGRIAHSIIQPEVARADIGTNAGVKNPWARGALDFGGNTAIDYLTGKFIQAPLVGGLAKGASALGQATGAYDAVIPGVGKSVNQLVQGAQDVSKVHEYFGQAMGARGEIQREAEGFLQRANQVYGDLKRSGVSLQGKGAAGQPVNLVDEAVGHWIEAGTPGAKFVSKADALNDALQLARSPEQAQKIRAAITTLGTDYSNTWQKVGNQLEQVGFLKPGTVQQMGGSYMARMYHATSHNPGDVEAFLGAANQIGGVNPKAVGMAEELLANQKSGYANASKARTLGTYAERAQHGGEFQASPVFAKSIQQQSGIAARMKAMEGIAADPSLVAQTYGPGKLQLTGAKYGAAQGLFVERRTKAAIDALVSPEKLDIGPWAKVAQAYRNSVVAGSLPMIEHHSKYVAAMAEGRLAQEGLGPLTPADIVAAVRQRQAYVVGGNASPAVGALAKNTRAFVPQTGLMNELGSSLRSGLQVENSAGNNLALGSQKLADQTRKAIGAVEQTFKVAMTSKLMAKYSPEEAARIAQEAVTGAPPGKALSMIERLGVVPFVTAKARSAPKVLGIAATRPDILLRYSGVNEAHALGSAMGPGVQRQQQESENPDQAIPVPGMKDRYGRQVFLKESPFALSPWGGLPEAVSQGFLGNAGRLMLAAGNAKMTSQGIKPLSEPGELPPLEKVLRQVEAGAPALGLGGTIPNAISRVGRAARGETQGGGPYREPETVGQAILGVALGARTEVPESQAEGQQRAAANAQRSLPAQQYAQDYLQKVRSGQVKIDRSPYLDKITQPYQAAAEMKKSYYRLQQLVTGQEGGFGLVDRETRIRNQVNWYLSLESRFKELSGREVQLHDLSGG